MFVKSAVRCSFQRCRRIFSNLSTTTVEKKTMSAQSVQHVTAEREFSSLFNTNDL